MTNYRCSEPDLSSPFWGCHVGGWAGFAGRRGGWRGGGHERWSEWFGNPPPRADRGGVRYLVLDAVSERARHGYEIISVIEEKSRGAYRPSPGVVYPTLQMLDELRHVRSVEVDGRKVYEITAAGKADLEEHRDEVDEFYGRLIDDSFDVQMENFEEIARRFGRLFRAFRRATRRGGLSKAKLRSIGDIVDDAVKKLEELLNEEEE
jgi:DNA-binding PadR family transcriptional regulator